MNGTSEAGNGEDSGLALKAKRKAGLARGDLFQDIIGGVCMLSVLLGDSKAVKIETPYDEDDRFDDIILETEKDTICIQVKNGPDYRFTETDLDDGSGRLNVEQLVKSAKSRQDGDAGSRFIVFTSYKAPQSSHVPLTGDGSEFRLFGGLNFESHHLASGSGAVSENTEVEFIFEVLREPTVRFRPSPGRPLTRCSLRRRGRARAGSLGRPCTGSPRRGGPRPR